MLGVNAQLFTDMADDVRGVLARPAGAEGHDLQVARRRCDAGIRSLRVQRPFLADPADFSRDLTGATHELRGALPDINPALETGTPVLRRSVALNERTQDALDALNDLVRAPTTNRRAARPDAHRRAR